MSGNPAGFNITHASRDAALFVLTTTDVFPITADNTDASSITVPDNNINADFCFGDADILISGGLWPHISSRERAPQRGYITMFTMMGSEHAEHDDTGGVDGESSEDDGCPQVPRHLQSAVHL